MTGADLQPRIAAIWRIESAAIVGALARLTRDLDLAEECAQDALVAALEQWPRAGVPERPGAWLMTAARNRALNALERARRVTRKHGELESTLPRAEVPDMEARLDDEVGDDLLRLVFAACHPVLGAEARVALTLRLVGGLTTEEIARAFVAPPATIAQRIVRAKKALAEARVPFEVPRGEALRERLASVLEVIYLVFNEGYAATAGDDWMRPALCEDALRLGRIVAARMPDAAEAHALLALMELHASRAAARLGPDGAPVLLLDQDRSRWDRLLIRRGLAGLERAQALGGTRGPYALQAAIAACHARAATPDATDWIRIAALYAALCEVMPSPVVELNRAVAVGMAFGPEAALPLVDALAADGALARYHLLPSVRGDLLTKLGRHAEAQVELARAAALTQNTRERAVLEARAAAAARAAAG